MTLRTCTACPVTLGTTLTTRSTHSITTYYHSYYSFVYLYTRLSTRSFCLSTRSTHSTIRQSFYNWSSVEVTNANSKSLHNIKKVVITTFEYGLVPIINKSTHMTKTSTTTIDHIIKNSFIYSNVERGIIRAHISDHFPVFGTTKMLLNSKSSANTNIRKPFINEMSRLIFKTNSANWNEKIFWP